MILIIEDNDLYGQAILKHLQGLDDEIYLVKTWEEAHRYIGQFPEFYWVDLLVPGYDTDAALLKVAEVRAANAKTTILVVSGACDGNLSERARKAGADAFSEKMDLIKRNQVIAVVILALLNSKQRGEDVSVFLNRARALLDETTSIP